MTEYTLEELNAVATINRISTNLAWMERLLDAKDKEEV